MSTSTPTESRTRVWAVTLALALALPAAARAEKAEGAPPDTGEARAAGGDIGEYLRALEGAGLIDVAEGSRDQLSAELSRAETLLRQGDPMSSAVVLYNVVESPAFEIFDDMVEYKNAEYTLGVALEAAGAYESALDYMMRAIERGPDSLYYAPAHRTAVNIALETRAYHDVLARIEQAAGEQAPSPLVAGERDYLRGRAHYAAGELAEAERALERVGRESRLRAAALYLRGVLHVRQGRLETAAESLCEVADSPSDDVVTFAVDERYFEIRDLARLGLGRIAHELGEYDDAYYHYFQVPQDAASLEDALFEAAWSMYQKRELATARWLIDEFLDVFPGSSLVPEAMLLSGYIALASCEFEGAEAIFEDLIAELEPVAEELSTLRENPDRRRVLLSRALARWDAGRGPAGDDDPPRPIARDPEDATDRALALLRLDPGFVRLHGAMTGLRAAAMTSSSVTRTWRALAHQSAETDVARVAKEPSFAEAELARAGDLLEDARRLGDQVESARAELRRATRDGTVGDDEARAEAEHLAALEADVKELIERAEGAARAADESIDDEANAPGLAPLLRADIARSRDLETESAELLEELEQAADESARASVASLYADVRRILDRAELGRIDTVIGQKRELEIEVQDLAAGRFPPELHGKMWEQGYIGEDEEYWPFEGEYWADEYEGWR